MPDTGSDTTVRRDDGKVIFTNQQTQTFTEEDFVDVYNDNVENLLGLLNKKDQMRKQRNEIIEENEEELAAINYVIGNETSTDYSNAEELEGEISEDTFQAHQQLEQIKEQMKNLDSQEERLLEQLDSMRPVATNIAESMEDVKVEDHREISIEEG